MTTTVTDQLLRDLVVGSHAEGTTCLAMAPAIEHDTGSRSWQAPGRLSTFTR